MFEIFFNYKLDLLLVSYIFGGLLLSSFKKQNIFATELLYLYNQKKSFYFLTRSGLVVLLIHFILFFNGVLNETFPFYDSLSWFEFYQRVATSELGTTFFRQDFLTNSFVLIVNICVLFYFLILLNYFNVSKSTLKYINEVPILIVTVFFSLKYFLLAYDFIVLIISLELASLCSIILLSLQLTTQENPFPLESAIKYFLFNAISMGFLLVSISGYYLFIENFNLLDLSLQAVVNPYYQLFNYETLLVLHIFFFFGYLMKLGSAPIHNWVPDVYEGAEFLFTAFLILVISPALNFKFFVFVKLLLPVFEIYHLIFMIFLIFGFLSIIVGVSNAVAQTRLKRFLAYASINHLGFILVSLGTPSYIGFFASLFYLFTYILTNLTFFGLILLIQQFNFVTFIYLNQLKSLLNYNYLVFFFFLIPLFSFAGFPPFAGFFGKLFVFASLLDYQKVGLACFLLIYIVLNAYLYLRFVKIALFENINYTFYIPINFTLTKRVKASYNLSKKFHFSQNVQSPYRIKLNLFILFILNSVLLGFLIFLPTVSLFCSQLIFNLFLFF
jgi:NADH-quinone oxidoreductase subunit N